MQAAHYFSTTYASHLYIIYIGFLYNGQDEVKKAVLNGRINVTEKKMKSKLALLITLFLTLSLTACTGSDLPTPEVNTDSAAVSTAEPAVSDTVSVAITDTTLLNAVAANSSIHEESDDYEWDEAAVTEITLNGDSISTANAAVTVDGSTATITAAGSYRLSGTLNDGQILVDTEDEALVRLILTGVDISSSSSAPIFINNAEKVVVVLADGTENILSDASSYVYASADEDEPNAALFSKADLTLSGSGSLIVNGNFNDGISSKDGLIIAGGNITVNAVDDGIRGKDYLVVEAGTVTVNSGDDGLKSDNEEDATRGFIQVTGGTINITASGDAIAAQTDVLISGGSFALTTKGTLDDTNSSKGIKGLTLVVIDGGTFAINTTDDAVHSNTDIVINGGTYTIRSGDDGMHADASLTINDGSITISDCYEGLESAVITINNGEIDVTASDDGINVASGVDGSGAMMPGGGRGGFGQDIFTDNSDYYLQINGGYIYVEANGDGLDANGAIVMTGGVVIVNGPTNSGNGALDYDGGFTLSGGTLIAVGSSGMAMAPGTTSTQYSMLVNFAMVQSAGTLIHIQGSTGTDTLTFAPVKEFQSIAFSSADLVAGATYDVYLGGSSSGTVTNGLYEGGSYSGGTLFTSLTLTDIVTSYGSMGGGGRMPGRH